MMSLKLNLELNDMTRNALYLLLVSAGVLASGCRHVKLDYGLATRNGHVFDLRTRIVESIKRESDGVAFVRAETSIRQGRPLRGNIEEFDVLKLARDTGRKYAYSFEIGREPYGEVSAVGINIVRNAIRDSVKAQYIYEFPGDNPCSVIVDFIEFSSTTGRIKGCVAVLMISTEYLLYDSISRKGKIGVRIGRFQFEDARRWVRKHIEDIATRSNIAIPEGDPLPDGARFYIERENLKEDGVYEIEFKTE